MKTYVIAEAGSSHDGQLARARELVDLAKQVGASCVKFQYWSDAEKLARQRKVTTHRYEEFRVPAEWIPDLSALAYSRGLDFMVTAFLPDDVAVIAPHVTGFKVSSFEAEFAPLLKAHAPVIGSRRLYVSLGMGAKPTPARKALPDVRDDQIVFLHCVSAYPADIDSLNLSRSAIGGYSDHCADADENKLMVGALSVAAGAQVIEAHLRLDATKPSNPDYPHSMGPARFAAYVEGIRMAERAMSNAAKTALAEAPMTQHKSGDAREEDATGGADQHDGAVDAGE